MNKKQTLCWLTYLSAAISLTVLSGCITTQTPLISHTHIGHATTAWKDTPSQQGLFTIAEKEAMIADEHASYAVENSDNIVLVKTHIKHVRHVLDPASETSGPGLGYGFIKAIKSSRNHIMFAADAADASENIKTFSKKWVIDSNAVLERSELIMALTHEILVSDSVNEVNILAQEVQTLCNANLYGQDNDRNGITGNNSDEYGILQLQSDLNMMLSQEDPPYRTIDIKYLFGLIRLPTGVWTFKDHETRTSVPDSGGSGRGIDVFQDY